MKQLATKTQTLRTTMDLASLQKTDTTAKETASPMPMATEYATNLKLKDASMKQHATTMQTQLTATASMPKVATTATVNAS